MILRPGKTLNLANTIALIALNGQDAAAGKDHQLCTNQRHNTSKMDDTVLDLDSINS